MHITTTEPSSDRTGAGATIIARANASVSEVPFVSMKNWLDALTLNSSSPQQFSSQACVKAKQQTPLPTRIPERKTALGALWAVAVFAVRYLDRVMHNALRLLKVPIAFLCFLCFLALSIHSLKPLLYSAFGPVCSVPVVSKFAFYHYLVPPDGTSQEEDILRLFNASYAHFERVIEGTASGSALAHRLDFAHMAMSDVEALVRNSDLASRDVIADAIQDTKDAAGTIAQELSDLDAKATFVTDRCVPVSNDVPRTQRGLTCN